MDSQETPEILRERYEQIVRFDDHPTADELISRLNSAHEVLIAALQEGSPS